MSKKLLAFAALSAWLAACSAESSTEGDQIPCVEDGDCPTGFSCGDGYCEGTSSSTADAGLKPSVDGGGVVVMASGDSQGVDAEVVVETDDCKGPSCEIEAGDSVTFSAPDVEGYRFTGWSGDERCVGVERTLTLTNVKANIQCVANYVKRVVVEGSAEGTRVTASSSAPFADCSGSRCVVDEGSAVVLSVDARDGYRFTGFVGTGCENTEGMSVSVTASKSDVLCTAGYVQSFAVTGSIEGTSGSVTASSSSPHALCAGGACSVDPGATVELTAPTLDDYRFAGWSGDPGCVGTAASLTLTVIDAGIDCTANYVRRVQIRGTSSGTPTPVALSASSTNSFAECSAGGCEVDEGSTVVLSAPTVDGYRFTGFAGLGCEDVSGASVTVVASGDVVCTASYVAGIAVIGNVSGASGTVAASSSAAFAMCSNGVCVVDQGSDVTLLAPIVDGHRFLGWSGDSGCTGNSRTLALLDVVVSKTCTANFEAVRVTVTGAANPAAGGSVSASASAGNPSCSGASCTVNYGTSVTLNANENTGYEFAGWSGDCSGTTRPFALNSVTQNRACTASFRLRRVTLNLATSPTNLGQVSIATPSAGNPSSCSATACTVDYGTSLTIQAAPTTSNARFSAWGGSQGCAGEASHAVTLDGNKTCTATYIQQYDIAAVVGPAGGGTVSASVGQNACASAACTVDPNTQVTLRAAPSQPSHRFVNWTGNNAACTGNNETLTLQNVDATCTANFEPVRVTVTGAANPAAGGSVSVSASAGNPSCSGASCTVNYGTSVTLNATENTGYEFVGWSGDCAGTTRPFALNSVTQNRACTASFRLHRVTLNLATSPTNLGQVSIATPSAGNPSSCSATACTVDYGTSLTIQAAPTTSNARFSAWGGSQGCAGAPSHAVTLDGNKTCTATYIQQYDIAAVVGPAGGGTVSASVGQNACASAACTVDPNTQVTLRAAPSLPSHRFVNWTGANAACTGSNETLTLQNVDAACTANFALQRFTVSGTSSPSGRTVTATSQSAGASCGGATCTVNYGSAVTLTATASTTDYQFHSWSGSGCSDQDVDQNPLTLTLSPVTASRTCTAVYRIRVGVALAAGSGSGGVNITNPGTSGTCATDQRTCWVTAGTSVTINAATTSAQRFVRWAGSAGCAGAQSHALTVDAPTTCQASFYNLWATSYAQPYGKSGRDALLRDFAGLIPGTDNQLAIVGRASHIRRYGIGIDTLDDNSGRVLSDRILLSDTTNMYGVDVAGDLSEHVIVGSYGVNPSMGMLQGGRDRETGFHYAFKSGANTNLHEVTSLFNGQYAAVGSEGTSREEQGRIVLIEPTGSLVANRALRMTMQDNQTCTKTIMPTRVEGFAGRATNAAEPYVAVGYGVYQFNDTTSVRYLNLWSFTSAGNTASVDVWLDSQGQSTYSLTPHGILALARGRFLIYGMRHDTFSITSATDAFWVLTDANLKPVAQGRLGNPEISEAFHHAVEGENGDIVLVGRAVRSRRQDFDALFVRLNREGVLQSQMLWASELDDTFNRVLWMPEGGYAISGTRSVVGAQSPFDFQQWAARTDENGSMPFGPNSGFNAFDPKLPVGAINATATPWLCHANTDLGDNRFDVTGTEADPETTETPHVP
jgi:hypothetical protein